MSDVHGEQDQSREGRARSPHPRDHAAAGGPLPGPAEAQAHPAKPTNPEYLKRRRSILWRFAILIAGTVVILAGIAIAPIPGPGPIILGPLGLAILATEFEWARRLLTKVKSGALDFQAQADELSSRVSRVWIIPLVAVYWFLVWQATERLEVRDGIIWAVGISTFIPVAYWCYRVAVLRARKQLLKKMYRRMKARFEERRAARRAASVGPRAGEHRDADGRR